MLLARVLAGVRAGRGRVWALSLLVVLVALVPLACASPPDPLWIAGIYDDADFDDVIAAVISATELIETPALLARPADIPAGTVQPRATLLGAAAPSSAFSIRGPPA